MESYEIKFFVDETQAEKVLAWAAGHLRLDSHAFAPSGTYTTRTLYLDSEARDVYHRRGQYKHHKFRLRRYGTEPFVFLERKSRWGDQVQKYRTLLPESDLSRLESDAPFAGWQGAWFHRQVLSGQIKPSYQVRYERAAYVGINCGEQMRLTLDRQICSGASVGWTFTEFGGLTLFGERVILELKYCGSLPLPFSNLIQRLALTPRRISKYRLAVQAWERISRHGKLWLLDRG